jgi:hypothetical protein
MGFFMASTNQGRVAGANLGAAGRTARPWATSGRFPALGNWPANIAAARACVHGHEKVLACGQLDVLAYGQVEVLAPL